MPDTRLPYLLYPMLHCGRFLLILKRLSLSCQGSISCTNHSSQEALRISRPCMSARSAVPHEKTCLPPDKPRLAPSTSSGPISKVSTSHLCFSVLSHAVCSPSMSPRPLLLLISIALYACTALTASICYLPNGQLNTIGNDKPCNASAPVSACCGDTASCLSNGMCKIEATEDTGISYARGTCTDKTWNSPACPPMCQLSKSIRIVTIAN
jgi:hypothetical protein